MKTIYLSMIILLSIFLIQTESIAQTSTVKGEVFTFDSIPVINATIKVKSSKHEFQTKSNGQFVIECETDDVLNVSANGFYSQKIKLEETSGDLNLNLKLKSGDKNLQAAIDNKHIGNTENFIKIASKQNDENDEDFSRYANIYEIIEGRFPGVQISNGEIIIRGMNRMGLSAADNGAIIVVNGIISNSSILNTIPTSEVKKITVLKDGKTAIYGSQGANGVVVIDTK